MRFCRSALVLVCGVVSVDAFISIHFNTNANNISDVLPRKGDSSMLNSQHVFGLRNTSTSASKASSRLGVSSTDVVAKDEVASDDDHIVIKQDEAGVYQVENKKMHEALLKQNPERLVVMKFYAPWCRACKGLAPRFKVVAMKDDNKDIIFAEMSVQSNKDHVKSLGILALPNVQFYAGSQGLVENFPCGPSKMPILKSKLREYLNQHIDKETGLLLPMDKEHEEEHGESEPMTKESISKEKPSSSLQIKEQGKDEDYFVSKDDIDMLYNVPYFKDFSDEVFSQLMKTATLQTFDEGAIVMRQGMPGRKFYVIQDGEVEVAIRSEYEDPLSTPSRYLGAVYNTVGKGNWFGERALITGENRAASLKTTRVTKCFVFNQENIPETSVLSGKLQASEERIAQLNEKYGTIDVTKSIDSKLKESSVASQARGSVNTPRPIIGVDIEEGEAQEAQESYDPMDTKRGEIFSLLRRFKLVQMAKMCYDHIEKTKPQFGNVYESYRRSLLLRKVTTAQKEEFKEVFNLIDENDDGTIQEEELLRVVNSLAPDETSKIKCCATNQTMTYDEFMSIMAEAEFYNLFLNTFNTLDVYNSGFVRAKELRSILSGIHDLISDEQMSIIGEPGEEGEDFLVNYEQFTKMLLGTKI